MNFYGAILILKSNIFSILCFIISRKVKTQLKRKKKDLCSVWRRCCDWSNVPEVVCEVLCWRFLSGRCSTVARPVEVDSDEIETLIEKNQRYAAWEIADILKTSKSSAESHWHQLGYVNRFDVWVPRKLSEKNLDCISACDSLLKRNENIAFLKQIVTGGEKWILYNNVEQKRSWGKRNEPPPTTPKAGLHPKKVMLCIWWDCKEIGRASCRERV